jgi:hypothetical protein
MAEMASQFKSQKHLDVALQRLCASHAFLFQENGELWRAAPFSAVPTAGSVSGIDCASRRSERSR